ncbi:tubulin-folding cofactor C [Iris pallida]|uniref:Tubulin-folding cofactor C n=1 Tax=Iris pallida TaxID=29817 RepID=A0AAX6IC32_IRIPA|nr:tubulin-folding cofactor C [Iris pallida]
MEETDPHPNPPPANKKHQAMLDRLANHQARRGSGSGPESDSAPAFESVSSFLSLFSSAKRSVESDLSGSGPARPLDPKPDSTGSPLPYRISSGPSPRTPTSSLPTSSAPPSSPSPTSRNPRNPSLRFGPQEEVLLQKKKQSCR